MHLGVVALATSVLSIGAKPAAADPVPIGDYDFFSNFSDVTIPPAITGIAGLHVDLAIPATKFFTPGAGVPIDTLSFVIDSTISVEYTDVVFSIDSGFEEIRTYVVDLDGSASITPDDLFTSQFSQGEFSFKKGGQLLLGGTFDFAQVGGFWGGIVINLGTDDSNMRGLDLYPGPAFVFENGTYVSDISGTESFTISLVGIIGGVTTTTPGTMAAPGIYIADLIPFPASRGSVNTTGTLHVIPEPSSLALAAIGLVALVGVARRRKSLRQA
jgi:hypothetical protein